MGPQKAESELLQGKALVVADHGELTSFFPWVDNWKGRSCTVSRFPLDDWEGTQCDVAL